MSSDRQGTAVAVLAAVALATVVACGGDLPLKESEIPPGSLAKVRPMLYDGQSACIFDARLFCHGNPTFSWDSDPGGGGTIDSYQTVCDPSDPQCKVRPMTLGERIRFLRVMDSLGTLGSGCQYAKTWLSDLWTRGRVSAYDYNDGFMADVHWLGPNDPMTRVHLWAGTWSVNTREFLRILIHEAAHASLGYQGEFLADTEELRCVP
jgi:hypothetical protein